MSRWLHYPAQQRYILEVHYIGAKLLCCRSCTQTATVSHRRSTAAGESCCRHPTAHELTTNQSIDRSTNQSINQATNQSIVYHGTVKANTEIKIEQTKSMKYITHYYWPA